MAEKTKIQWTDHTFNPWRGCSKVHTGCASCYAWRESRRFPKLRGTWGPDGTRVLASDDAWHEPVKWNAAAREAGERRRVFCASLADVFELWDGPIKDHHGDNLWRCGFCKTHRPAKFYCDPCKRPAEPLTMDDLRGDLFALIDCTHWLDWQIVTKRPERIEVCWPDVMRRGHGQQRYFDQTNPHRDNVWLLTSVSDQATADTMLPELERVRGLAAILGVSFEPMVSPVDFRHYANFIDWIIFGGESGPMARACNLDWIRVGLNYCREHGVAPFVKQAGSFPLVSEDDDSFRRWALGHTHLVRNPVLRKGESAAPALIEVQLKHPKGGDLAELPDELQVREFPVQKHRGAPRLVKGAIA